MGFEGRYLGENAGTNGLQTLMEACKLDDYRGVEFLLANGASPSTQDFKGNDGLYYAVYHNSLRALQVLLIMGGSRIPADRTYGKKKRGILTIAAIYSHDIRVLESLLDIEKYGIKFNGN